MLFLGRCIVLKQIHDELETREGGVYLQLTRAVYIYKKKKKKKKKSRDPFLHGFITGLNDALNKL